MKISPSNYANKAADLVAQMTLQEKTSMCSGANFWQLKAVKRLGIKRVMVTDGPHGLRKQSGKADHLGLHNSVPATCFPTSVALAASWDCNLLGEVGVALGRECAKEDVAVLLGPGVNIKRHPACGRNFEYSSEDPLLAGECAAALINGVQSQNVGTSIKHFAANNQEQGRMVIDTIVDERTLREIYLTAFEIAVKKSQPWTVMCAYNRLNGEFCSENDRLLNEILRDEWGFKGFVVTDWGAQNDRVDGLAAGLDLEMPGNGGLNDVHIDAAIASGTLSPDILDRAVTRIVQVILAAQDVQDQDHEVDLEAHHGLAQRVSEESAVLLKNEGALLPFEASGKVAVIGGFAQAPRYQGAGSSLVNPYRLDQPLGAIEAYLTDKAEVAYAQGFDPKTAAPDEALIEEAVRIAKDADKVLLLVGLPASFEGEGSDRTHLRLPDQINRLTQAVLAANPNVAVVLSNGGAIEMPWVDEAPAILDMFLAGQAGAGALPRLIFGDVSPSGKLAETFPIAMDDCASDTHFPGDPKQVVYREGLNVGYRFFSTHDVPVLFPFGHGLSYASFEYGDITLSSRSISDTDEVEVTLSVTNTGECVAAEVVQIYVRDVESSIQRPDLELRDFVKVRLQPGESKTLTFTLSRRAFTFYDIGSADWQVEAGTFEILAAASVSDIRARASLEVQSDFVSAQGPEIANSISMSDADMAALGKPVPTPDPVRPFHINSTLGDIRGVWLGRKIYEMTMNETKKVMGDDIEDEDTGLGGDFVSGLPLRNLASMSGGKISMRSMETLILTLNGRYLKALIKAVTKS